MLQETHTDTNNVNDWYKDWGDRNIIFAHGNSSSRGVAILLPSMIDYKINSTECDPDGRYIVLNITINNMDLCIINGYAPTSRYPAKQSEWLTKIQTFIEHANDTNII